MLDILDKLIQFTRSFVRACVRACMRPSVRPSRVLSIFNPPPSLSVLSR